MSILVRMLVLHPTLKFPDACKRPIEVKFIDFYWNREFDSAEINLFVFLKKNQALN